MVRKVKFEFEKFSSIFKILCRYWTCWKIFSEKFGLKIFFLKNSSSKSFLKNGSKSIFYKNRVRKFFFQKFGIKSFFRKKSNSKLFLEKFGYEQFPLNNLCPKVFLKNSYSKSFLWKILTQKVCSERESLVWKVLSSRFCKISANESFYFNSTSTAYFFKHVKGKFVSVVNVELKNGSFVVRGSKFKKFGK